MKYPKENQQEDWPQETLTPEERNTLNRVYSHLIGNEERGWDGLDDYIECLDYLDNDQLCREAEVLAIHHSTGVVKCHKEHAIEQCFIPLIVECAGFIIQAFKDTEFLHEKNRYILQYYLAFQQADMIVLERH